MLTFFGNAANITLLLHATNNQPNKPGAEGVSWGPNYAQHFIGMTRETCFTRYIHTKN